MATAVALIFVIAANRNLKKMNSLMTDS